MRTQGARLWLVRHGQTDWNVAGRVQGHTPTELNEEGRRQARVLAEFFLDNTFAACWTSDLPRAAQTADIIVGERDIPVTKTESLRERSFREYEGQTSAQISAARTALGLEQTGDLADWTNMPGIESNDAVWERVSKTLLSLSDQYSGKDVLVVTHGGVIARAVYRTLGIEDAKPRRFPLSNGIIVVVQWRKDHLYLLSLLDAALVTGRPPAVDTATVKPA